ncbi:serine/threonine protein kinase [Paenibacillus sp. PCH8]|nr:serine/threonine protein kinase [Paenibacillus sp. PCH8]
MIALGRFFSGIDASLNKPHGKKVVMEYIVNTLSKGQKQYKPFVDNGIRKFTWPELSDALEILLVDGIIQVTFRNQRPRKGNDWLPSFVLLDPRAVDFFSKKKPDIALELDLIRSLVNQLLSNSTAIRLKLIDFLDNGAITDELGTQIVDHTSLEKFKSIILGISHYFNLKEQGRTVPIRHLSNQMWGQSKILAKYKKEIALLSLTTIEKLDTVLLPDINSSLDYSLVAISSIEELHQQFVHLSNFLKSDDQADLALELVGDIRSSIISLKVQVQDYHNNHDLLQEFVMLYDTLIKELEEGEFINAKLYTLKKIKQLLITIKNQLLKADNIKLKFELIVLDQIGKGAFARVYKVFDPEVNEFLACKVLFPKSYFIQRHGNDGEECILRFKREVRLLTKQLQHDNIVKVEKIHMESSPFWFTMPLATCSLHDWLKNNRDASEEMRIEIFKQIVSGVKYMHGKGKFHRDLAPKNILLYQTEDDLNVRIADFGLAKDPESLSLFTGKSKRDYGHEDYTDPEQLNSLADSSNLSDIYSLGALLYNVLSNKPPKKRKYVKVRCQKVITKAMDIRKNRYQTVSEFEEDLAEFYTY